MKEPIPGTKQYHDRAVKALESIIETTGEKKDALEEELAEIAQAHEDALNALRALQRGRKPKVGPAEKLAKADIDGGVSRRGELTESLVRDLRQNPGQTTKTLAQKYNRDPPTVHNLLDRAHRRGEVQKEHPPGEEIKWFVE